MTPPSAPNHILCHRTAFKKKCADLCDKCWLWCSIPTKDGSEWMCADLAQTRLTYSLAGETNGVGRAVESLRNTVSKKTLPPNNQGRIIHDH